MAKCRECGGHLEGSILAGVRWCDGCGRQALEAPVLCAHCLNKTPFWTRQCERCGGRMPVNVTCPDCKLVWPADLHGGCLRCAARRE